MDATNLSWISTYSFPADNYVDFHSHNETEIILYTKAKGITTIADTKYEFKTVLFAENDLQELSEAII